MRAITAVLVLAAALRAEAPVRVEYTCPAEDIESFGLGCSADDPCAVFLEIAGVESVGTKLFVTGNLHTATVTLYGVALASEDGGTTWAETAQRVKSAALDQIEFVDLLRGWIGGQRIEPLPRDPFLLATTDGGETWTERPVFEDQHFGSIAQFWFDTKDHGQMVIDSDGGTPRHERYESTTGGASWELKESAKEPIRLKTAKTTAWRVRADEPTKMYFLEKRAGSAWETAARFLIHVADCK